MKKMKCIIVDDEPVARKILREFVQQVSFIELCGEFENAARTELFLRNDKTDLVFLDIEMPKRSGLDLIKSLPVKPLIILTTAYPEYALEGYELDIIDYLLKPIAFQRFLKAVQKAKEYAALKSTAQTGSFSSALFVRSEKRIEKIEIPAIFFIESTGNYVSIVAANKRIIAYLTLKSVESQLPVDQFIKVHQSYLVNFSKIESIEGNQLIINNKAIPIGRNFKDGLMRIIDERLLKR